MKINPYLIFNGQCDEAFKLYHAALGGYIVAHSRFGDMPDAPEMPEAQAARIMHVCLQLGDYQLMGSDSMHDDEANMGGFSLSIQCDTVEQAHARFNALSDGGEVTMPVGETFWAKAFGMCKDRFGVRWMVNVDHEKN